MTTINMNEQVQFGVTITGVHIYNNYLRGLDREGEAPSGLREGSVCTMLLWEFMYVFGAYLKVGSDPVVQGDRLEFGVARPLELRL
jgi:hypothetical protein